MIPFPVAFYKKKENIPSDFLIELDAANTFTGSQWNDSSGNNYHLTQANGANQPTKVTNIVNGLPVIRFNGSSNFMDSAAISPLNDAREITWFIVLRSQVQHTGIVLRTAYNNSSNVLIPNGLWGNYYSSASGVDNLVTQTRNSGNTIQTISTTRNNNFLLITCRLSGTNFSAWENGILINSLTYTPHTGTTHLYNRVGANPAASPSNFLNGDIAQLRIFNRALSDSERVATENNLIAKFNL
jgi:hypothetical protein